MHSTRIQRLGHHGDGIAAGPVYAPLTLPGEEVTGDLDGQRLTNLRIVTPSGDRVAAPCRHFKSCGGCSLQHASDDFVKSWKADVVRHALSAHNISAEIDSVLTSPPRSRRRATLSVRRTKKGALAGFHARASDTIIAIPDCTLIHDDLRAALPIAESLAGIGASRKGELSVQITRATAGLDVSVTGGKPLDGPLMNALGQATESLGLARLAWDGEIIATRQQPDQMFGTARVVPPPGAFLQATEAGEKALVTAVTRIIAGQGPVADLFAGCGTFTLPLAQTTEVHAVEGDPAMTAALDHGWRNASGLKRVTTEARDLFRRPLMPDELKRFGGVVIDPPRAGAEAQIGEIALARVPTIAHVSCNPVTFARDAARLIAGGYAIGPITIIDQFRWSPHVEIVAGFHLTSL